MPRIGTAARVPKITRPKAAADPTTTHTKNCAQVAWAVRSAVLPGLSITEDPAVPALYVGPTVLNAALSTKRHAGRRQPLKRKTD
jgi:hypothetical protein